jgi:hypothetical protein
MSIAAPAVHENEGGRIAFMNVTFFFALSGLGHDDTFFPQ